METSSLKELKVSINPKEIGELLITVTMESGKMKANIEANSKDSYNLLMSNLEDIKKAMASNEVSLQDINVSINQGDTTFFKDSSQRQENQNDSSNTGLRARKLSLDDDVIIAEDSESLIDSQINMLA
jgi:flagellar hook-length control protein FliK